MDVANGVDFITSCLLPRDVGNKKPVLVTSVIEPRHDGTEIRVRSGGAGITY
jgi:hypothetical protein